MFCKIADFIIDFQNKGKNFSDISEGFLCETQNADIHLHVTITDAEYEKRIAEFKNMFMGEYAVTMAFRKLAEWLPNNGAFVLHSACFDVSGEGVAFAAHSGTGKTTHMRLWQELLGDKMVVVNGDKPIVRILHPRRSLPFQGVP